MNQKNLCAGILSLSAWCAPPAFAATIVDYTFDTGTTTLVNPHDIAANPGITSISAWTDRDSALVAGGLSGNPSTGRAIGARSFGAGGSAGNEFHFSFDVIGTLSLSSFSFWEQGSSGPNGNGPSTWTLFVNNQQVGTGAATLGNPGGNQSGALALSGLSGTVNLRLFATGAANDANATWRVDNFSLNGTVIAPVPLPAALPLILSAAGLLGVGARRRA